MSRIPNPTAPDQRSLNNGRINFQINCAVCHGPLGHGDGPATRFGMAGISLVTDITKGRTDGYIFGMIRNGRGLMPTYNRTSSTTCDRSRANSARPPTRRMASPVRRDRSFRAHPSPRRRDRPRISTWCIRSPARSQLLPAPPRPCLTLHRRRPRPRRATARVPCAPPIRRRREDDREPPSPARPDPG